MSGTMMDVRSYTNVMRVCPFATMRIRLSLLAFFMLISTIAAAATSSPQPMNITTQHWTIMINHKPVFVQGVTYNPSAIGTSPSSTPPWGDFLTAQWLDLWERDLPMIKAMGATTIRVATWNNNNDHHLFLDTAYKYGLNVIVTFFVGNSYVSPVGADWQRANLLGTFKWQVSQYLNHPALLGWTFGAELNAPWNNYLNAFNDVGHCGWNGGQYPQDPNGCFNNPLKPSASSTEQCKRSTECVYAGLFSFMNEAAKWAKEAMGSRRSHLIIGALADTDLINMRLKAYESTYASAIDAWGLQIYRGADFGVGDNDFITEFERSSHKPLIVTEFGVDAYNDPCGKSTSSPCYNFAHDPPPGYGEDEETQAEWILSMATQLTNHSSADDNGACAGGIVYEWLDEFWRTTTNVRGCYGPIPYGKPGFDASQCEWKAHVDCPEGDLWYHSLCGWYAESQPDHYANQAWFGIVKNHPLPGDIDAVIPRIAYGKLRGHWNNEYGPIWILLIVVALLLGGAVAAYLYTQWQKRMLQLNALGISRSWYALGGLSSSGLAVTKRTDIEESTPLIHNSYTPNATR